MNPRLTTKHAACVVALVAICAAFFLPALADRGGTFVGVFLGKGDAEGTLWWNWVVKESVMHGQWPDRTASMFHPVGCGLAPFYGSSLNSLLYLPVSLLLPLPFSNTLYCLLLLIADALIAYAYFARRASPLVSAGLAAAWAFSPMKFMEYRDGHLPQIPVCFVPLVLLALDSLRHRGRLRTALAAGAALALDACGYYQHAFGVLILFTMSVALEGFARRRAPGKLVSYLRSATVAAGIVAALSAFFYGGLIRDVARGERTTAFRYPDLLPEGMEELFAQPGGLHFERTGRIEIDPRRGIAGHANLLFAGLAMAALFSGCAARRRVPVFFTGSAALFGALVLGPFIRVVFKSGAGGATQLLIWRSPIYKLLYDYVPGFSRLYWPDTFWPYAVLPALAALAVLAGRGDVEPRTHVPRGASLLLGVSAIALAATSVATNPFTSRFERSEVLDALARSPGSAFVGIPAGVADDYHLFAVVTTGKSLVGGRGRELGYLVPSAWRELAERNPTLRSLATFLPRSPDRALDPGGAAELAAMGADRILFDKGAVRAMTRTIPDAAQRERILEEMLSVSVSAFGPPLASDDRYALFMLGTGTP